MITERAPAAFAARYAASPAVPAPMTATSTSMVWAMLSSFGDALGTHWGASPVRPRVRTSGGALFGRREVALGLAPAADMPPADEDLGHRAAAADGAHRRERHVLAER